MLALIFNINNQKYAIDISYVHEVIIRQSIKPLPNATNYIAGVTDVRGTIYTCVDLSGIFFDKRGTWSKNQLFILTNYNDSYIAFIVDSADNVIDINDSELDVSFKKLNINSDSVESIFKYKDNLVVMVNVKSTYERILNYDGTVS